LASSKGKEENALFAEAGSLLELFGKETFAAKELIEKGVDPNA
jgi:hypothetical protein